MHAHESHAVSRPLIFWGWATDAAVAKVGVRCARVAQGIIVGFMSTGGGCGCVPAAG